MYLRSLIFALCCFISHLFTLEAAQPIALYLTWQHDPTQTMTVVWLTALSDTNSQVEFQSEKENESYWKRAQGSSRPFPYQYPCRIHTVELTGLSPNTRYRFRLDSDGTEHAFVTLPAKLQEPLTFIEGGDCYHNTLTMVEETNRMAVQFEPAFVFLGGDLAYAAGKRSSSKDNIPRWIAFMQSWTKIMTTKDGRLIPLLVAMGNHDVNGYDDQTQEQALVFHHLFPLPQGKTSYQLIAGDYLSLTVLDSGHCQSIPSQTQWLNSALAQIPSSAYRFVFYHVPAYPSVRSFHNSTSRSIREFWLPLFEKYRVDVAFEHHDHAYKRTHPLLEGRITPQGVIYLGDGSWGAKPRKPKKAWYLAKTASSRQFIVVSLSPKSISFKSVTPQGQVLDAFEKKRVEKTETATAF